MASASSLQQRVANRDDERIVIDLEDLKQVRSLARRDESVPTKATLTHLSLAHSGG